MFKDIMQDVMIPALEAALGWLTDIFDKTGAKPFYIAIIFIVMLCGFILANFRVAMYVGSDFSIKPGRGTYASRTKKMYNPSSPPAGYIGPGNEMRWR